VPDIFLSYSREDQATASRFAEAFGREGFNVWWDQTLRSGEAYDEVTETALRDARAVVVLWSKKSVVSRWVRAEATLADRNRTLVPAMIEPCERPIMFELTQTADLSRWKGEANDRDWLAFVADVRRSIGEGGARSSLRGSRPVSPPAVSSPAPADHRPSLAILPFANRSGKRVDDVFADGMVEDLVSALSLNSDLKVIAQSASVAYRKNVSDLRTIGRELGVRYLLEGNVRRIDASLRVTAQLVEAEGGAILWSQKFDRPLTELAALQERLVSEVAGHLGVQLERVEVERALKKPGDLTAWEAVMRSIAGAANYTGPRAGADTIVEARRAVAIAPEFALGHAALADALAHQFMATGGRDLTLVRDGMAHAERALVLAPADSGVAGRCAVAMCYFGRWQEALQHARRAVELNPNQTLGRSALGMVSIRAGRPDDAIANLQVSESLSPRGVGAFLLIGMQGLAHFVAGRHEQALAATDRALLLHPGFVFALGNKVAILAKLGRREEARATVQRVRTVAPDVTLEDLEAANSSSFLSPEASADLNRAFREVWLETPIESTSA
jgi:TolB-like protein